LWPFTPRIQRRASSLREPLLASGHTLRPSRRCRQPKIRPPAEIQAALRAEQLEPPAILADAYGAAVTSAVAVIAEMSRQLAGLEAELAKSFEQHRTPRSSAANRDWAS
jgi:hypothetical protein